MNTLLKQECLTRIKNNLCLVCGKELKKEEFILIKHKEFGEVKICAKHIKDN